MRLWMGPRAMSPKSATCSSPCSLALTLPYDSLNRQRVVDLDVAVEIDGVRFSPGDLVIADADGVVVVPQAVEEEVLHAAWEKVEGENRVRESHSRRDAGSGGL